MKSRSPFKRAVNAAVPNNFERVHGETDGVAYSYWQRQRPNGEIVRIAYGAEPESCYGPPDSDGWVSRVFVCKPRRGTVADPGIWTEQEIRGASGMSLAEALEAEPTP